jgi:hypothetical protein
MIAKPIMITDTFTEHLQRLVAVTPRHIGLRDQIGQQKSARANATIGHSQRLSNMPRPMRKKSLDS